MVVLHAAGSQLGEGQSELGDVMERLAGAGGPLVRIKCHLAGGNER